MRGDTMFSVRMNGIPLKTKRMFEGRSIWNYQYFQFHAYYVVLPNSFLNEIMTKPVMTTEPDES